MGEGEHEGMGCSRRGKDSEGKKIFHFQIK